ncbi:MAG TPA: tyrosine-type recombinase/integrase [Ktedonobacterales bacterium]|jgi:site-specific recombinase XerD|nr:tyrosine-type recombinase/integrase [Ktedonobacterales bacterium]
MHDELFEQPAVVARYRAGPYAESRERFLQQARAVGYSPATLESMAWALLVVAEAVHDDGGVSYERLRSTLLRRVRLKSTARPPSANTAKLFLRCAKAWLRSIGALTPEAQRPLKFAGELRAFTEYMRVEQGLSPTTIAGRDEQIRWFCASLPSQVRSLDAVTLAHVDAFLRAQAQRGWSRRSLHTLGGSLRSFFRYAASQRWCRSDLASGIELPRLYALEHVPRAPSVEEVGRLLKDTASSDDPVNIRDHAILSLLIYYGLRRGEVERLTLDDLDWVAETIHVTRPKQRRAQCYPMSVPVGEAILRYLRLARPRCSHRALFLTIQAPFRPLSGPSITFMVRKRLTKQGVQLNWRGAHCLRHACASQLLDAGFTLKQIADHLGHRSMDTTRIYTKIDLHGLRQVAEIDLGALL